MQIEITGGNFNLPIKELEKRFRSVMLRLPVLVGNEALNFVLDNFKKQGFQGAAFQPWNKRKNTTRWGTKPKRNGRSILVDTARLKRSWRMITGPAMVTIGTDVPYAKALNNGYFGSVTQNVSAFTRKKNGKAKIGTGTFSIKSRKENQKTVKTSTDINVKAHQRNFKANTHARPMIGESPYLTARCKRIAEAAFMKEMKM